MHTDILANMHATCLYTHTCMHRRTHTHTHTHTHTPIQIHTHTHTHTHIQIHTHTHYKTNHAGALFEEASGVKDAVLDTTCKIM